MVANGKITGRAWSIPAGLAAGWGCSMAVTILLTAAVAYMLSSEKLTIEMTGYGSMITLVAAAATGAQISWRLIRHRRAMVCMLSGVCYFLSLMAITALFFGGQYSGVGVTAILVFGSAGGVTLLGLKENSSSRNHRKKYPYR